MNQEIKSVISQHYEYRAYNAYYLELLNKSKAGSIDAAEELFNMISCPINENDIFNNVLELVKKYRTKIPVNDCFAYKEEYDNHCFVIKMLSNKATLGDKQAAFDVMGQMVIVQKLVNKILGAAIQELEAIVLLKTFQDIINQNKKS